MMLGKVICHHAKQDLIVKSSSATEVALYESSPDAAIQTIATKLEVNRNTLQNWLKKYGTGVRINTTTKIPSPNSVTEAERIRQLEQENARL